MPIPLDDDALSLFNRTGKIGGAFVEQDTLRATTLADRIDDIVAGYDTADQELSEGLYPLLTSIVDGQEGYLTNLQTLAENTLITMADDDNPLVPKDLTTALERLLTQMRDDDEWVDEGTAITIAATEHADNVGDGEIAATISRNSPHSRETTYRLAFDEVITLTCTTDRFHGATEGQETFSVVGEPAAPSSLSHLWPGGSGVNTTLTAIDPTQDNAGGNLLTNSAFQNWDGASLENWAATEGAFGTAIVKVVSGQYRGDACLKFVNPGSTSTPEIRQLMGDENGTLGELEVDTTYLASFWLKGDTDLASGVLRVSIVDAAGTVVARAHQFLQLSAVDATWQRFGVRLQIPATLPDEYYFSLRISTTLANGNVLNVADLAMTPAESIYPEGPILAVFSGATSFLQGDKLYLTVTSSSDSEMLRLWDRLFDLKGKGMILPHANTPTISDALIT